MTTRARARSLAAGALLAAGVLQGGCRTRGDVQRDYARTLLPAQLAPEPGATRPIRAVRVRVHVDEDYRAQILRWRDRVEAQLGRANRILGAQFGIRLEAGELRPWSRTGGKGSLAGAVSDLVAADPGAGADWVIAFVSSSELLSGAHEQLGTAVVFGRHLVLRGMVSFEEEDAFRRTLDALSEAERESLLRERQLHRETAVLLHEWAHTLGAIHEKDDTSLMSPRHDTRQAAFSPAAARIVRLGLEHRDAPDAAARAAWAAAYREEIERSRPVALDAETVQDAIEVARAIEAPPPPGSRGVPREPSPAPESEQARPGDAAVLAEAEMNDHIGDPARAWRLVEPLAARYPERGRLQEYACHVRRRAEGRPAPSGPCRGAKPLAPGGVALLFGRVLIEARESRAAVAALMRAEAAFAAAAPPAKPAEWAELALALASIDACTVAERAAARAPREATSRRVVAGCAKTRRLAALPASEAGVEPVREPEYVEAMLRARTRAGARRAAEARAAAIALQAAFPRAAGGAIARCLAEAAGGTAAAVRDACTAAERAAPWALDPVYVLGMLAGQEGRWQEARDLLSRAIERDADEPEVWARLGAACQKLGDAAELEALDKRHRARFGSSLRPRW